MRRYILLFVILLSCLVACGRRGEDETVNTKDLIAAVDDPSAGTDGCLRDESVGSGAELVAVENANLRESPSTSARVLMVVPESSLVTAVSTEPQDGFYQVSYQGREGWSYGRHYRLGELATIDSALTTSDIIARARTSENFSYWWGHGVWSTSSTSYGSCSGGCPDCSHSGSYGADCSGMVAKAWIVPDTNSNYSVDSHPYTSSYFYNNNDYWDTVARGSAKGGDAMVHEGHILIYEGGDPYGSPLAIECAGCATGCLRRYRSVDSTYKVIRRRGLTSPTASGWMSPQRVSKLSDSRLRAYVWSGTSLGMSHITQSAVGSVTFGTWTAGGGALGSSPVAAKNADGSQIVFARSSAGELVYWKSGTTWTSLGGNIIGTPAVGTNADGTLTVFVHSATTGGLAWKRQTAPSGSFGIWNHEDGNISDSPAVGRNPSGTLQVFVHSATTGGIAYKRQTDPNAGYGSWNGVDGNITGSPAVAAQSDGALRVFVHSVTTGGLAWIGQASPGGELGIWHHLNGNIVGSPAVGRNSNGTLIVYVKSAMDGGLAWIAQPAPDDDFGLWHHEGGSIDDDPTVVTDSQGIQWVFVHSASNDGLSFKVQLASNGYEFGIWHSLGGHLKSL